MPVDVWSAKDERQYKHIKDSGASKQIAAATVNKQRRKEGRLKHPDATLVKSTGEGSRGGHIIGHTKSGKPIYRSYMDQRSKGMDDWTAPDHWDAAEAHRKHADEVGDKGHHAMAKMHDDHAKQITDALSKIWGPKLEREKKKKGKKMSKGAPNVDLVKATKKGEGSRGGKVVRHTKSGKPVYEGAAKKQAETSSKMMHNWHDNAERSGHPEHHAVAAKQALHAAYFHHHAGDDIAAHDAMSYANHHRAKYEKAGHKSRTTTAVEKLHGSTAHLVGGGDWAPEEYDLPKHPKERLSNRSEAEQKKHGERARGLYSAPDAASMNATHASMRANQDNQPWSHEQAAHAHSVAAEAHSKAGNSDKATVHYQQQRYHAEKASLKKSIGGNMSKNAVQDLFKSELGEQSGDAITKCVHCAHDLTREDLQKGLTSDLNKSETPHFVADDNDQPHSGALGGQVEPSRPGGGVKENDEIAPLLKSCKGPEHGESEEFIISKSEMAKFGMNVGDMEDGWYKITKSTMKEHGAGQHIAFLQSRKNAIVKSQPTEQDKLRKSTYSPRAGGATNGRGEPLVHWVEGSDAEVAKYIEQSGGYGPGTDESIRTQGNGK